MKWDSNGFDDSDCSAHIEEVERAKKAIKDINVGSVTSRNISLDVDGRTWNDKLNFKRPVKRNVNFYKYREIYNVGKTEHAYLLTRNFVVMMLEEHIGAEVFVKGAYKPKELNGDVDDKDALLLEITAESSSRLQESVSELLFVMKSLTKSTRDNLLLIGKYVYKDGMKHRTSRIKLSENFTNEKKIMNEFHDDISKIALETLVDIRIRGRGSGYIEPCFNEEAEEPVYIQVISKTKSGLEKAEKLCLDVISKRTEALYD